MSTQLPDYPWQVVATDLFELDGKNYLLTVDYFSRYPEVTHLKSSTTSATVIEHLKRVFSRHSVPEIVRSDNGPQFSSHEFAQFASLYEFSHVTSSPKFPQSNGHVERAVKTVKEMIQKSQDPYLALLSYRATPLPWCGLSPAELCMGRKIRTPIPQTDKALCPDWKYLATFRERNHEFKETQGKNFNKRHRARHLPPIPDDTDVWITSEDKPIEGKVKCAAGPPRSYVVETPSGELHRNRSHLQVIPSPTETQRESGETSGSPDTTQVEEPSDQSPVTTQEESTDPPAASAAEPEPQTQSPARAPPAQPQAERPTDSPRVIMTRSRTGTYIRPRQW